MRGTAASRASFRIIAKAVKMRGYWFDASVQGLTYPAKVRQPFNVMAANPFEVRHTGNQLKELADYLKGLDGETRVLMEHTGRYYEPIVQYLHNAGPYASAVNPKLIKDSGGGTSCVM